MSKKRRNDLLLFGGILLAAVLCWVIFAVTRQEGAYAVVERNGAEIARYSLAEERQIPLNEGENANLLVIEGGKARMKSASCPDQICVAHRPVSKTGETIVCLPHQLVVRIAEPSGGPDLVV